MKYELTSQKLNGSIIFVFSDITGQLTNCEINAVLENSQIQFMCQRFPLHSSILESFQKSTGATVRILDESVTFEMFWEKYGRKENKIEAKRAWDKHKSIDQQRAFAYITRYDSLLQRDSYRQKMLPASYLNKMPWMDIVN